MILEIKISSDIESFLKKFNNDEKVMKKCSKAVKTTLYDIERDAKENLEENDSVDSGRLKGSITTNIISSYCGEVGTNVEYAECVEYGTRPHTITPKNKKALYWEGAGHPVKSVQHPGSKAKPFMGPATKKNEVKFNKKIDKIVKELGK